MPTTEQQRNYIREIQRYLRTVSQYTGQTPSVGIDGIYGDETAAAISAFQRLFNLPINGDVDKLTFDTLRDAHLQGVADTANAVSINGYPIINMRLTPGMRGFEIYFLQVMIDVLREYYQNIIPVKITGVYDKATQNAVEMISAAAGSGSDGAQSGKNAWNAVTVLFNNAVENLTPSSNENGQ